LEIDHFDPFFCQFLAFEREFPDPVLLFVLEGELYFLAVGQVSYEGRFGLCEFVFWFGRDSAEGEVFEFVAVEEFALLEVEDEESLVGEKTEVLLLFLGDAVVKGGAVLLFVEDGVPQLFLRIIGSHIVIAFSSNINQ
jgi:hypothetical protein